MPTTEVALPEIDNAEMFRDAMAPEPEATPEVAPEFKAEVEKQLDEATAERSRDEQGRFTAKTEPEVKPETVAAETAPAEAKDEQGSQIPGWRARELSEARKAAEQRAEEANQKHYALQQEIAAMREQMASLQKPKQEPVDFFADPEAAFQQRQAPLEERFAAFEARMRLNSSRALAIATHGKEQVDEMDQAVAKAMRENHPDLQHLAAQMRASDDPVGLAIQWHKRNKLWDATGGDPEAYRNKILEDALKDPKFQAKVIESARTQAGAPAQSGNSRPNIQLPPSLNKAPGSGAQNAAELSDADLSDASLFRHAMSSR